MKIVAVTNHKGGVGKSGVSVCLAGFLAEAGCRVLVIDLDQQATASEWLGVRAPGHLASQDTHGTRLGQAIANGESLAELVQLTGSDVDCIPCGTSFATFERSVSGVLSAEGLLRRALASLDSCWDVVFLDCPPSLGLVTANALVAADLMLVPVEPKSASRTPILTVLRLAREVQTILNPRLGLSGIVASRVQPRIQHRQVEDWLRHEFGNQVFRSVIRENTHISESHAFQRPITTYAPDSNGAVDFRALGNEFLERLQAKAAESLEDVVHG